MPTQFDASIVRLAEACVDNMGDIFWDYNPIQDARHEYAEPRTRALTAVASTLQEFADSVDSQTIYSKAIRLEYQEIIDRVGERAVDADIVSSLVADAAWTREGAQTVLKLARNYGTSILRNALALAEAMAIEDGAAGF